ncbi:MAG: DUF2703 domain-containing protein [Chloroflexi bacterium]|nr:DUF2703 domain-containing protein [Chloroflexota bacterium]|tara:strand:- start:62 stop:397 length:336 start_codon:yes stop_codon:yes gene_type:complete
MEIKLTLTERGNDHHAAIRQLLQEAIAEAGVSSTTVDETIIRSDEEAIAIKCLGSPTIRINGLDIEYREREPEETTAGVRYYNTPAGWKSIPEKGLIIRALERALADEENI